LVQLPAEQTRATTAELADIPPALRDVLPARLLSVAHGQGLDRLEEAICILSDGLAARVDEIVADNKSLLVAAQAFSAMACAMERVVSARVAVSFAHRSYCEGDRLLAEAELHRAKAKNLNAEAAAPARRAGGTRESDGTVYFDPIDEEVFRLLREGRRPSGR
jgi:hypothetical protein